MYIYIYEYVTANEYIWSLGGYKRSEMNEIMGWVRYRLADFNMNLQPHSQWRSVVQEVFIVDWHCIQLHNQKSLDLVKEIMDEEDSAIAQ